MQVLLADKRLFALLTGNIISSIGSGISMTAVPWLLLHASLISGGLASMVIDKLPLHYILFIDAATYIIGFTLIALVPYKQSLPAAHVQRVTTWTNMKQGFLYLKEKPLLTLFSFHLLCHLLALWSATIYTRLYNQHITGRCRRYGVI